MRIRIFGIPVTKEIGQGKYEALSLAALAATLISGGIIAKFIAQETYRSHQLEQGDNVRVSDSLAGVQEQQEDVLKLYRARRYREIRAEYLDKFGAPKPSDE
uniref:Uncharacterized protein n=1 Tax=Palpitomonas bilix TaxID=652834 RepID=A0A7S3GGH4_9EUKA|mmetsp:Transcript_48365/g.125417  ORF Transcript_48365/g.125417 Transcript_48365/m.125417 type:complete len:102 (+) Transcript_48365:369-674(+)|eukprot:CAMPEP_0113891154 /NCGR_PEP_ID=MMETSP0780_2-20120614/14585_1 /TAXON_ID=652834 /ORGANISM="Palpitomonas bilix" /LENGTH=101 /DNA_ID=CAMNT_0000880713 /DNA_START=116 /DNA_END=421 /DNA_ORIENTATION=+ /assembly_acc=CAM_ASM_000599